MRAFSRRGSPLGDHPVGRPPDRVAPAMTGLRGFADLGFIDFHPQAGAGQAMDKTVLIFEDIRIDQVVQQIAALIVMNPQALLLDKSIWRAEIDLQAGGETDRPERTMRSD